MVIMHKSHHDYRVEVQMFSNLLAELLRMATMSGIFIYNPSLIIMEIYAILNLKFASFGNEDVAIFLYYAMYGIVGYIMFEFMVKIMYKSKKA